MFGNRKVNLPDAKAMSAALADFRAVQLKHDARLMLLLCLDRAAHFSRQLKALGMETDESLDSLFASGLRQAKEAPRVAPKPFNPDAKPTGKAS